MSIRFSRLILLSAVVLSLVLSISACANTNTAALPSLSPAELNVDQPRFESHESASPESANPAAASPEAASRESATPALANPAAASPSSASPAAASPSSASPAAATAEAVTPAPTSPSTTSPAPGQSSPKNSATSATSAPSAAAVDMATPAPAPALVPRNRANSKQRILAQAAAEGGGEVRPSQSERKVRIALLLPLSGRDAAIGRVMLNAAMMAVFDFGDQRLVLQPYDTEAAGGAKNAAQRALSDDVSLIIGPLFGRQVTEVAELASRRSVNLVSFSNDPSVAGGNVFVFGISPSQSLGRTLDYAMSKSITSFATLLPDDSFGRLVQEIVKNQIKDGKGSLLRSANYSPTETNFSDSVKWVAEFDERRKGLEAFLKNQAVDPLAPPKPARSKDSQKRAKKLTTTRDVDYRALVLSESGQRLLNLASLIPYYDINTQKVKIIGLNSNFDDRNLSVEPALNGAWFAAPDPSGRKDFDRRYAGLFGAEPARLSSLCYDLVGLAAVLSRRGEAGDFSTTALRNRDGFVGIDGIFRFAANNTTERGLAVLEIQRTGPVVISKAPTKFGN